MSLRTQVNTYFLRGLGNFIGRLEISVGGMLIYGVTLRS